MHDISRVQEEQVEPGRREAGGLDSLMTVREVAAYLSVSRARVYQLIRNNRIRAVRLSTRGTRVFVSSLEDYLRSKLQG